MPFKKGDPKPENSGRRAGVPNKSKQRLAKTLREHGADLEALLAKALIEENIELIKALTPLIAYVAHKPRVEESTPVTNIATKQAKPSTPEERLALIRGIKKSSE